MKIAGVLSISAVFAFASLVMAAGCSAPTAAETKDKSSASQNGDEDDKGTTTPGTTKPGTTTPGTTTPGTTPGATDGPDECLTCVGATTKAGLSLKCEDACKEDDQACFTKCGTDNCGADGAACKADFDRCATQCSDGPEITDEQEKKYLACIAPNAKLKAYDECATKCNDAACDEKCWTDSKCDQACDDLIDKCEKEAGIPQD